jgi:signal peptidase II
MSVIPKRLFPIILGVLTVVVIDAITKAVMTNWIGPGSARGDVWLIDETVGFAYGENTGIAFGILRGQPDIALGLSLVAISALIFVLPRVAPPSRLADAGAALVAGGALGNLIDRLRFGHVRDFIAIGPWPPFNLADSALTIGVGLMALAVLLGERREAARLSARGGEG